MPYTSILPVFGAIVGAEALIMLCFALVPRLRVALPWVSRVVVGSVVGFLAANAATVMLALVSVGLGMVLGIDRDSRASQTVAAFVLLGLFIGPLVVSPLGFLGGAWLGYRRAAVALRAPS